MIEVLRTNNLVRLDYAMVLLKDAGCYPMVADRFIASTEGGISAFQRRVLVPDEHASRAKDVLKQLDRADPPPIDDSGYDDSGTET